MIQASLAHSGKQVSLSASRIFLYEVIFPSPKGAVRPTSLYPHSHRFLKIPAGRMNQEMQRITRLGGKIVSIHPLTSVSEFSPPPPSPLPWWVEVTTEDPRCLYYFGPFASSQEASAHQGGYVEDLQGEGARGIGVALKQCPEPPVLTVEG
jgi:hypothetical protein